jgi:hypothetical protein
MNRQSPKKSRVKIFIWFVLTLWLSLAFDYGTRVLYYATDSNGDKFASQERTDEIAYWETFEANAAFYIYIFGWLLCLLWYLLRRKAR